MLRDPDDKVIDEALAFAVAAIAISSRKEDWFPQQEAAMTDLLQRRIGADNCRWTIAMATSDLTGVPNPNFHEMKTRGRSRRRAAPTSQ
jgi:hypothetical protein